MGEPRIEVLRILPGSIVWLHNVDLDDAGYETLRAHLCAVAGHEQFEIVVTWGEGQVEVLDQEGLIEAIRARLATPARAEDPIGPRVCSGCGAHVDDEYMVKNTSGVPFSYLNEPCGHRVPAIPLSQWQQRQEET